VFLDVTAATASDSIEAAAIAMVSKLAYQFCRLSLFTNFIGTGWGQSESCKGITSHCQPTARRPYPSESGGAYGVWQWRVCFGCQ
jgi:hypothetical protein